MPLMIANSRNRLQIVKKDATVYFLKLPLYYILWIEIKHMLYLAVKNLNKSSVQKIGVWIHKIETHIMCQLMHDNRCMSQIKHSFTIK